MFTDVQRNDLTVLFKEVSQAHHKAYIETDGVDPEWPIWYADFMHEKVMDILDLEITKAELIYLFVAADLDHREEAPDAEWSVYYADFFSDSLA